MLGQFRPLANSVIAASSASEKRTVYLKVRAVMSYLIDKKRKDGRNSGVGTLPRQFMEFLRHRLRLALNGCQRGS